MPRKARSIAERFWPKVDKTSSPYGCWLYTGATQKGYGCLQVGTHGKSKLIAAHRIAYQLLVGPIPEDMELTHDCPGGDNKLCCNPAHCVLRTRKEHADDTEAKGQYHHPLGTANGKAKLTPEKVRRAFEMRRLGLSCRAIADEIGGVTGQCIYDALRGHTWRHLKLDS